MSVVLHFQSTGIIPGDGRPVPMRGTSITIGRGKENDLVLPDPDRVVSTRHCAIEDQNGNVVVIDLSTNGTFLNYGKVPLGRVPTPLNDGDILCIGGYELAVRIAADAGDARADLPPLETGPLVTPSGRGGADLLDVLEGSGGEKDFLDELLGESGKPIGPAGVKRPDLADDGLLPPLGFGDDDDLLAPGPDPLEGMGGSQPMHSPSVQDAMPLPRRVSEAIPDDWDFDLPTSDAAPEPASAKDPFAGAEAVPDDEMGGAAFIPEDEDLGLGTPAAAPAEDPFEAPPAAEVAPPAAPEAAPAAAPVTPEIVPEIPAAPPQAPPPAAPAASDLAAARALLEAAGVGEMELAPEDVLPTMTRLGNVLRIMIHGMREILMTRTSIKSEFRIDQTRIAASGNNPLKFSVTPEQAVEVIVQPPARGYLAPEAAAEQALQDIKAHEVAMMTGMEAALKGVLRRLSPEALEGQITDAGGLGSLLKGRKARYWETYEKIYADVADQAENDFQELFSREFARAYQEQLTKLKGNR